MARRFDLSRLLRPRSIAVVGGKPAAEVIRQSRRMGFAGEIWPVHPQHDMVEGLPAFRSVAELPGAPDAVFLGINRHAVIEVTAALAARGAGGAVCYASGFAETGGEGTELQARLVEAAGAMPVLGPNCYGVINYLDGALLWPDQHGGQRVERGVALVTQSSNIAINLTMQRRGLPIAYVATLGNQAVAGLAEMVEAFLDDPRVTAIGLHIEGLAEPAALARAAARARRQGVPILAVKTGRSAEGAQLTLSHTASLAGADAVTDAFLRRIGVVRVASLTVLLEALKLLHVAGPLPGRDIVSMSCSGGEAALIADAALGTGLRFRPLDREQTARVAATVSELVTVSNPFDYHTFIWANAPAMTETFSAMMAADFDLTLLVLDLPRGDRCSDAAWVPSLEALVAASHRTDRKAALVASMPEGLPEEQARRLVAAGVAPLLGIDDALAAIAVAAEAGDILREAEGPLPAEPVPLAPSPVRTLSEWDGKRRLAAQGVPVPEGRLARSAEEAVAAAEVIGFPVVLKATGADLAHKTELGAVRLSLADAAAVRAAAAAVAGLGEALLVERMVGGAVAELIVGIGRDPLLGLHLVLGSGGTLVELVGDRRILLLPAGRAKVAAAIRSLKVAKLLDGHRGRPPGDLDAAVDAVLAIQDFALAEAGWLAELDVNPLMVTPSGAVAADVLLRVVEEADDR
ncbi:acetate--CoA ligase family protein [Mycobacterium sp. KBS0706]|uniref:acetate--CoA ligase family protein n=1 Tax=Mycobacterium sp. KBS0706 TaxID=2578109 RepID=UPI00110F98A0|nr:acetate--CoA ligase family protein [Mycobacterium sp. KBS0706]TSD84020.1 acetate--CoA ligase family protein [Mycobacterium sp. KBS0706]